jgi:hypothetical protein
MHEPPAAAAVQHILAQHQQCLNKFTSNLTTKSVICATDCQPQEQ